MMNNPARYEIRIQEELSPSWSEWFDGLTIETNSTGETVLSGQLPDQAALLGILNMIHDLNLKITSVKKEPSAKPR